MGRTSILIIASLLMMRVGWAQEDSTYDLQIEGYLDSYYSYNFNKPQADGGNAGSTAIGRIFDIHHNQFSLGLVQTMFTLSSDKFSIVADLTLGPNAELANYGNSETGVGIKQAYLEYNLSERVSMTAGQFGTHIGYELVDAPSNANYSLSYLFGNGPFYHTGLKLNYQATDVVGLMLGVVNGWDNSGDANGTSQLFDNNQKKSIIFQTSIVPSDKFSAYINWIGGDEQPASAGYGESYKQMVDLTTSYSLTDAFTLGLNAALGGETIDGTKTSWSGVAGYLNYQTSDAITLGGRIEWFDDSEGTQYIGTSYTGITLSANISLAEGHIIVIPEFRSDMAADPIYFKGEGFASTLEKNQNTVGVAFIGKF